MKIHFQQWTGAIALGALIMGLASTAAAVDPGIGVGGPGPGVTRGVGAPGVGVVASTSPAAQGTWAWALRVSGSWIRA